MEQKQQQLAQAESQSAGTGSPGCQQQAQLVPSRNDSCNNSSNSKRYSSRLCMGARTRLPADWRGGKEAEEQRTKLLKQYQEMNQYLKLAVNTRVKVSNCNGKSRLSVRRNNAFGTRHRRFIGCRFAGWAALSGVRICSSSGA
ncbi:MAG: hypothetical protein ACLUKQ_09325 [Peptococcaceae bacterium]